MKMHEAGIRACLQEKIELSGGLAIFRFSLEADYHFKPGQYATLWLTHQGATTPRPYSIASSPSETRVLEFYINLVKEGRLTPSLWDPDVLEALGHNSIETRLAITGPKGRFVLDPSDLRDLVFVASGTGLAPFVSMIRWLNEAYLSNQENFQPRRVYVIHGVSFPRHLGYYQELQSLALETLRNPERKLALIYLPTISRPSLDPAWKGLRGRAESIFSPPALEQRDPLDMQNALGSALGSLFRPETHAVYVCGHPGTVDGVVQALAKRGFKVDRDIKREKYFS
jgi:ferredoxin/flavodoxin---NADP+ reductase